MAQFDVGPVEAVSMERQRAVGEWLQTGLRPREAPSEVATRSACEGKAETPSLVSRTPDFSYGPSMAYARFIIDEGSQDVRLQIVDEATGEVIREIPPEKLARMASEMRRYEQLLSARASDLE